LMHPLRELSKSSHQQNDKITFIRVLSNKSDIFWLECYFTAAL